MREKGKKMERGKGFPERIKDCLCLERRQAWPTGEKGKPHIRMRHLILIGYVN